MQEKFDFFFQLPDVIEHKFFLVLTITLFGLGQVILIPFVPEAKS